MLNKLPVNGFEWGEDISEFDKSFIKSFLELDAKHSEKLHHLRNDRSFLPQKMKIEKVEKLVANVQDKKEYLIYIKRIKTSIKL